MKKFKTVFSSILLASVAISLNAQQGMYSGSRADNICKGSTSVYYGEVSKVPSMITFGEHSKVKSENVMTILSSALNMRGEDQLIQYKEEADEIGFTHYRFQQYYNTIKVENGQYLVHSKNGSVQSVNGFWVDGINISVTPSISEQTAIQIAMKSTNASRFKWQMPEEEAQLKKMMSNSQATYYPKPELVIVARDFDYKKHEFHLCYKFDIYADTPMSRNWFYVDATSGEIIAKENSICNINVNATGNTMYSGVKPMITDSFAANTYRLRETARGLGVETYDMNTGTNYGLAVDFTNNSTFWNVATNYDRAAYDAHWGAESTYDYYLQVHSRNSIDNAGQKLYSYVHYDLNQNTGFWNGIAMSYGDGNHLPGGWNPATSLDVCGHEFTHGVTRNTAALLYVNESGALNESFSDIFGCSIEFFANPSQADWLMCEDIMVNVGTALRNLSNPNQYNQPDTYLGTNWATGFADFGGVHTNSGVQNFWYYLLCQGGVGVNDIASNYTVTGIGISDAERIAYRNLVFYIPSFATFMDARMYSIQAAQDIFGACSQQVISTTNAWYAVGVGSPFSAVIDANFTANGTTSCSVPFTVNFSNTSVNATNATWYFGDNTSSNVYNPSHTYTLPGTYSVKLVCSSSCGASDSILQSSLITITTPPAPTTTGASSCTSAALNLSASGTGNLNWFANPSGGTSIHTGTNFTTPVLPATTTYYVDNQIAGTTGFCGPADNTFGSGGNYGNIYEANMIFNVMQACTLRTVKVFCYNAGTRNITLRDVAGNLLQDYSVTLPVGQSTVNLNFPIEPGTGYRLGGDTLSMSLNNSNISYPYILNGVASITGCSASSSTTQLYLFFYNWEFETAPCTSVRTPVVGTINTPPTVTYTAAIDSVCFPGNAIALIGGSPAGGTYSGTGVSAGMFDPAVSGIGDFVVTYSYTDGNGCNATAQQTIHVDGCMGVTSSAIQTGMSVSPNPSDGNVTVEIGLARNENAKLRIMNSLGQIVRVEEHHLLSGNNKLQLNLSNLAKGIYYIQIQTSTDLVTKRIDLN